ncbi:Uncharacterized conserved protein YndB, AHSA1/START domain [Paramicrobacterium humi]|uniref:Uncharacterized conserved protein YndB, AHSA1/START domain n=1 Tax=Paramicrobacterium humi TaxID=640635 RepID=A0A1H4JLV8_9MICO|nr:SRPBCC domain-containing protein [Microbacterium humi]SEB46876.1 Uncharacterized conserved protein YndB, AHSA1/START domain [Microbacterium humi]
MTENHIATSTTSISATPTRVWSVLTDPEAIRQFMFGTEVETSWQPGSRIVWRGTWQGSPYEDKGEILEFEPEHRMVMTHFSPLTGLPDEPENYHTLTWTLTDDGDRTELTLEQDNNPSAEAADHSREMWDGLVATVKAIAEKE